MPDPIKYFREVLSAIAVSDCSKDSLERIFTHKEVANFGQLTLMLVDSGQIAISTNPRSLSLLKYYLSLLSQTYMGAEARKHIAVNIIEILSCPDTNAPAANKIASTAIPNTQNTQKAQKAIANTVATKAEFEMDLTLDDKQGTKAYQDTKNVIANLPDKDKKNAGKK